MCATSANTLKSGEVWVNELRLREYNNEGGWAAQGNLNMQLSDLGTVNVQGRFTTEGFGGLEEGVMQRTTDDYKTYSVTTNFELGKFFPDKAKVSIPLYYHVSKEKTKPKYNPLDTDMLLDDALDATESKHERDSIESIAVTKTTTPTSRSPTSAWASRPSATPCPTTPPTSRSPTATPTATPPARPPSTRTKTSGAAP